MRLQLLLVHIILLFGSSLHAQLYTFRNFNHRDGLYMASINCLQQTKDGYLWIGTDGGDLVRYDGEQFLEIRAKEGDNNHHFNEITVYGDSLLIASQYKGYFTFLRKENTYVKLDIDKSVPGDALCIVRLDSTYYFVNAGGIGCSDLNGHVTSLLAEKDRDLTLIHHIVTNKEVIFFTNKGSFVLKGKKLKKLDEWLGIEIRDVDSLQFGFFTNGVLELYNATADHWVEAVMNTRGGFFSIKEEEPGKVLDNDERIVSSSFERKTNTLGLLTNKGRIFTKKNTGLKLITHNYEEPLEKGKQILSDLNGDFWICSDLRGIYKVSLEGFTKLQLLPLYQRPDISFIYTTIYGDAIISTHSGETFIWHLGDNNYREHNNFSVYGATEINGDYFLATNIGIKQFNPESEDHLESVYFPNMKITMITSEGNDLYAGVAGKGLYRINLKTGDQKYIQGESGQNPDYFYTAQMTSRKGFIYFGTNDGIFKHSLKSTKIERVSLDYKNLGGYSGVSTRDIYGTLWFTLEKAIIGITENDAIVQIGGDKTFNTNIFYTLNSDSFGNLIVGTNKGIHILKIDKKGNIKDNRHYDGKSGFDGYETHMRSQFQNEDGIYVGTVEGLFLINTRILENLRSPLPPVIENIEETEQTGNSHNNFVFEFHVNNAKAGKVSYSYRVLGYSEEWATTMNNRLPLYNLGNGDYILEVRSSYDGIHYSDPSVFAFTVDLPIWQSNWFIIGLIVLIVAANIILLRYNKAFEINNLLDTKDTMVHLKMTPGIILFATISVTSAYLSAPYFSNQLEPHIGATLTTSFILLTLYFLSLSARSNKMEYLFNRYLIISLIAVLSYIFYELYLSHLHPYHIIGIIITSTVIPFIFNKIRSTIIFSMLILALSTIMMLLIRDPVYPKGYFLTAILVMVGLLIFTSYLRYDSIEKMMFISGIINKGNIPAIAFNNEGIITYASENISLFINAEHDEILGNHISTLNHHIPFEGNFRDVDVLKEFKDGGHYLVPMLGKGNKSKWIEWSYKDFSSSVKVMLGQDVSDRMELENTYELLVQNAEDFIYRCDISGNFVFLNDVCFTKLGYEKEELVGKSSNFIVDDEYKEDVEQFYQEHFDERKRHSYKEFPIRTKSGVQIWVGQHVTTLYAAGSDSYINGFIALARDITIDRQQQQLIRDQRDNITASINYARRIQYNLLPHERTFASSFKEHFIIYKPKDIVSGDFYWMYQGDDYTVLALADCTGHGVPGSFMTLLGLNLLNAVVQEDHITDPGSILNEMDRRLSEILPRGSRENKVNDGMELSVCLFTENSTQLAFACAGSRFLILSEGEFTMYKGDIKHIGDNWTDGFESYQTHYTELNSTDQLYLFTDGFKDQFGGPNDKKYSFRRFLELLEANHDSPLHIQRDHIENEYDKWIGNSEQTDDLTLISIIRNDI